MATKTHHEPAQESLQRPQTPVKRTYRLTLTITNGIAKTYDIRPIELDHAERAFTLTAHHARYLIAQSNGVHYCSCPSFTHHGACKHVEALEAACLLDPEDPADKLDHRFPTTAANARHALACS